MCVCVSSSHENNKLGVYNDIYKYLCGTNPRVLARALYRYIVTVCACICMVGGIYIYVCLCVCSCRSRIAGRRDLRCRFYGYRANGLGIYVHLLFAALRYSGGSHLAVNNIPAEGMGAKGR